MQKSVFNNLFNQIDSEPFEVTYWDNTTERYGQGSPTFHLLLHQKLPIARRAFDNLRKLRSG